MTDRIVRVPLPAEPHAHPVWAQAVDVVVHELLQEGKVIGFPNLGDKLLRPSQLIQFETTAEDHRVECAMWVDELGLREWLRPKVQAEQDAEHAQRTTHNRPRFDHRMTPEARREMIQNQALDRWSDQIAPFLLEDLKRRFLDRLDGLSQVVHAKLAAQAVVTQAVSTSAASAPTLAPAVPAAQPSAAPVPTTGTKPPEPAPAPAPALAVPARAVEDLIHEDLAREGAWFATAAEVSPHATSRSPAGQHRPKR